MTDRAKSDVSLVVPVFRSEASLPVLVERASAALGAICGSFEIVLVDDGSGDGTWGVIEDLARRFPQVRGISLFRNHGQHNALLCGIRAARYDVVVTVDDDLQHPPEEIPKLLEALTPEVDVVYGVAERLPYRSARSFSSWLTKVALRGVMGADIAPHVTSFRAFRRSLRDAFQQYQSPLVCIDVLLTWATTRFAVVEVRHEQRKFGTSGYSLGKLLVHAGNLITGFSVTPLRFASLLGFGCTVLGFVLLAFVVGRYLAEGTPIPGFPFLASTILLFSGIQLFVIGVLGEYLARVHLRTMEKPAYVIRTTVGKTARGEEAAA